ncbi:MAG: prepilin peptidase [Myxococcales bacterium]|nr:prepilin peptidase [Myxococcales bacterium]
MFLVSDFSPWFFRAFAFCFGALWGSFYNVAIYRWPREMSVVSPPSHCPGCGKPIEAWRNLPIVGYFLLKGRAACCGFKLSPRYALVEFLTAMLTVALVEHTVIATPPATPLWPAAIETLFYFFFLGGLVIATFVDLDWMEIPDEVSLPGAALGLASVTWRHDMDATDAALGAGAGYLLIQVLFVWSYERILGRRGMGEGDSKLLMMIGAFLGWKGALFALVGGAVQGLIAAVVLLATGKSLVPDIPERPWLEDINAPMPKNLAEANALSAAAREARLAATNGEASGDSSTTDAPPSPAAETGPEPESDGGLKMPYGPFLALGAIEFFFFGDRITELFMQFMGR